MAYPPHLWLESSSSVVGILVTRGLNIVYYLGENHNKLNESFWSRSTEDLLQSLGSSTRGLTPQEAEIRVEALKSHRLQAEGARSWPATLLGQFRSPIIVLLVVSGGLSLFLGDIVEGLLILLIIAVSGFLGFWQERRAAITVAKLIGLLTIRVAVWREGNELQIPIDEVVPGDIVALKAGSAIPGDACLLESKDLFVDESPLTGESFPAEKYCGVVSAEAEPHLRTNALFFGTHVVSGTGRVLIIQVGDNTVFGKVAGDLAHRAPETAFESGIRHFGYLLLEVALALALVIFAVNVGFHRPILDSFLFTLALTVGLTPQLLPAIQGITMARGAARMTERGVIVRRPASIEDIGGMDVLCTDKTGTLTQGNASLQSALDPWGATSVKLRLYAYINASLQAGYANPIDESLRQEPQPGIENYHKTEDIPYDFSRRRLSVVVEFNGQRLLVTKGALDQVLEISTRVESAQGTPIPMAELRAEIKKQTEVLTKDGFRCLGVAYRELAKEDRAEVSSEKEMIFVGTLGFSDPLKPGARESLAEIRALGIDVKLITGDNGLVAAKIASEAGFSRLGVITGTKLRLMNTRALTTAVTQFDIFAEMDPNQKERIIAALKKAGHSVGYLGDGINDAPSIHTADVGISVDTAVDIAKQAADIVLMRKDLSVLAEGIREGRRAFSNTMKYIFITTSANFGNMLSMAGASFFAAFLPMLPGQILLLNVISDLPAMAIASDQSDPEMLQKPRRWKIRDVQRFMLVFGLISTVFDFLTFGTLLLLKVPTAQFRTAWFLESVLSELMILVIIRTQRWSFKSRMGKGLLFATLGVTILSLSIPYLPYAELLGFQPLPIKILLLIFLILGFYGLASELAKGPFYRTGIGQERLKRVGRQRP